MQLNSLTFITGNAAKAEQLEQHLAIPVQYQKIDLPEIQSLDLHEIIKEKAKSAYAIVQSPVFVEDTSLIFNAIGKLPGPLIKWFLKELGNDGICKLLHGYSDRTALAQVSVGLFDGKNMHIFDGEMHGSIAPSPKGMEGFGWDPVFIPRGAVKTWGEMSPEEQKETSMRRIALKKLEEFIRG